AAAVHEQRVAVAVARLPALDVHAARDGIAPAVGLVGVVEPHAAAVRATPDDVVGDADRAAVPQPGTEVGVDPAVDPDLRHDGVGVGGDGQRVHAFVGGERGGEERAAGQRGGDGGDRS